MMMIAAVRAKEEERRLGLSRRNWNRVQPDQNHLLVINQGIPLRLNTELEMRKDLMYHPHSQTLSP